MKNFEILQKTEFYQTHVLPLIPVPPEPPAEADDIDMDISSGPECAEHKFDAVAAAHSVYAKVFVGDAVQACNWTSVKDSMPLNSVLMEYARMNLHYYRQKGTDLPHPFFPITLFEKAAEGDLQAIAVFLHGLHRFSQV